MYASDYLYASSYFADTSTTTASSFYYGNKNWLYKGFEWTITPRSSDAKSAFSVYSNGNLNSDYTNDGLGVRPTFYLKSNVLFTGGAGTFDDPYTISM